MNRRLEDEIALLAFGDADPKRTAEIERIAETDPAVRKALAQYRAMRQGLQAMSPSIDHQLSSERLREEILRRGLEPKRRGFDWRWATLPLAAAGAFALVAWWPSGSDAQPVFVEAAKEAPRVALSAPVTEPDFMAEPSPMPALVIKSAPPKAVRTLPQPLAAKVTEARPIVSGEPERVAVRAQDEAAVPSVSSAGRGGVASPAGLGFGASVATFVADKSESDPIVVIQPVRDANTGAYRATEVASPSNVLIGS